MLKRIYIGFVFRAKRRQHEAHFLSGLDGEMRSVGLNRNAMGNCQHLCGTRTYMDINWLEEK